MLTLNSVKELKNHLEQTLTICNHMLQTREYNKLFNNEMDMKVSETAQKLVPQDYYKLRTFDSEIELRYNNRIKQYYVHFDLLDYQIINSDKFKKTFSDYELEFKTYSEKSIFISTEYDFKECVNIFYKMCIFILSNKIHNNVLFEVY